MGSSVLPCSFWLQNSGVTQMWCSWRVIPSDKRFKLILHLWPIDKKCQLNMVSSLDALVVINDRSGVPCVALKMSESCQFYYYLVCLYLGWVFAMVQHQLVGDHCTHMLPCKIWSLYLWGIHEVPWCFHEVFPALR